MNEESQVRGCYNNVYLHQPGNSVGSPLNQHMGVQTTAANKHAACLARDTVGKRTRRAQRTSFNTLDNRGHKTPIQSKKEKDRKEKIEGT